MMFAALLGPALSFGSSLISGLGARQSAKKQQKMQAAYEFVNSVRKEHENNVNRGLIENKNTQNYNLGADIHRRFDHMRIAEDGYNAGFNPVTWLNAMGGTYGAMQQLGYQLKSPEVYQESQYYATAPTAQVPSVMEAVGGALSAGVNTYLADARVEQSQNFQRELLQTQISAIQRNGGRPLKIGNPVAPSATTFFGSGSIPYAVSAGAAIATAKGGALTSVKPHEITATDPVRPYLEPGRMPEIGLMSTTYGGYAPAMSKDAKDRFEEDLGGMIGWNIRNRIMPSFGFNQPSMPAPWGYRHVYNPVLQEYQLQWRGNTETNYRDGAWGRRTDEADFKYRTGETF